MQSYFIDVKKHHTMWRRWLPFFLLMPILISLLVIYLANGFSFVFTTASVVTLGVTMPLLIVASVAMWFYQSFGAVNKMVIEIQDSGILVTLPTRQIHLAKSDFLTIKENSSGLFMYTQEGRPFCVPKTLQRYDEFRNIVKSWVPYEFIPTSVERFEFLSNGLRATLALSVFIIISTSSQNLIFLTSGGVILIFGIAQLWLFRWSVPAETRQRVNRSVYGMLAVFIVIGLLKVFTL